MASRSSWSRFSPITLSAATRDRRHRQDDELYAARCACFDLPTSRVVTWCPPVRMTVNGRACRSPTDYHLSRA
jgi:hypothetical protein